MRTLAQVEISPETTLAGVMIAKSVIKAIKKEVNGSDSALECMELETESTYQVTTYRDHIHFKCPCNLRRVTPLQIEVGVQYITPHLEISWLAEGVIDDKHCYAEITALATWENGWYKWYNCGDNGAPRAPYAEVFIKE